MTKSRLGRNRAIVVVLAIPVQLTLPAAGYANPTDPGATASSQLATSDVPTLASDGTSVSVGEDSTAPGEDPNLPDASSWPDSEVKVGKKVSSQACDPATSVTLQNLKNPFNADWSDSASNELDVPAKFTLKAETATTFKWNVSVKIGTSANFLLFAKVSAEINAGIEHSKTTTYGSSVEVTVKPGKTVKGDRGMWQELVGFTNYNIDRLCRETTIKGKSSAPYREHWRLYY